MGQRPKRNLFLINPFKPEFTIVIFISNSRLVVDADDLKWVVNEEKIKEFLDILDIYNDFKMKKILGLHGLYKTLRFEG